ncbi:MAG: M15 family metallopeptidase [Bdellovibrionota bacterium]
MLSFSQMLQTPRQALEAALRDPDFVDLSSLPNVRVDLRYGSKRNLLGRDVYGGFQKALMHKEAAAKFKVASDLLAASHPALNFLIFDALRPQTAQVQFWELVRDTPQQPFFADPARGSIHSYGFAVDLGLATANGAELDLGTPFDDLTELAGPQNEDAMLAAGRLSRAQLDLRLTLRSAMEGAGFIQLPHEWWHYDALPAAQVRATYRRCE